MLRIWSTRRAMLTILAPIMLWWPSLRAHADEPETAPVEITYGPLLELHHWVRAAVDGRGESWTREGFTEAVERAKVIAQSQRSSLDWETVDALITRTNDLDGAMESAKTAKLPWGVTVESDDYRAAVGAYFESLRPLVDPFIEEAWPERRAKLESLAGWLDEHFIQKPEVLEWHAQSLVLQMPDPPVTLVLVTQTGWPGGFTHRDASDHGISYVALMLGPRELVYETVVHELTHALEVQDGAHSVPSRIRSALIEAGIHPRDRAARNGWHTIYFIQSAMTTKKFLDPDHVPYGEVHGLYERMGPIAEIELRAWEDHHAGDLSVDEAVDQIVEEILALTQDEAN